ncbi:MAG: tetratricopeptide repeat protein [Proteobacteria bacterium]|nr:tetratricopeptide repeat protein [Pseudomonadota bacterium]
MYDVAGNGMGLSYAAAAMPLGNGVAAVNVAALDYGTFDWRDENGNAGVAASTMDFLVGVSYGFANPRAMGRGWTGIGVEGIKEAVGDMLVAVNVGTIIPVKPRLTLGLAVLHMGMRDDEGFSLPAMAKAGASYLYSGSLRLALDVGYGLSEQQLWVAGGGELTPYSFLALRAGYKHFGADQGLTGVSGLSAGAGFRFGPVGVDYAYQPFGDLALSHRFALLYGLGPSDAEIQRKQWQEQLRTGVSTLGDAREPGSGALARRVPPAESAVRADGEYQTAVGLYSVGDYDGAWRRATAAVQAHPRHWQAWQMIGNCQYAKGDRAGAVTAYRQSLELNPENVELKAWVDQLTR